MKKVGILRFLGTNCDRDVWKAVSDVKGLQPEWLWHADSFDHKQYAAFILPGGFSYGDYLRCGALAAKSPAMISLREAAEHGSPVLGICNGFQILCESGLLPGALVRNQNLRFNDKWVDLHLDNAHLTFQAPEKLRLPVAHGEGRYVIDEDGLKSLEDGGQIWLRYLENPNGSLMDIAGVMNKKKNVAALMPHPERAVQDFMGSRDGVSFFMSI